MSGERAIAYASLDWEAGAPRSIFFDDIYFSGQGPEESRRVFIDGNDLPQRLAAARRFAIGELGFGTGLNALVAADCWRRTDKQPGARLDFLSFEKHPLAPADLRRAHAAWPQFRELSERMIAGYPPPAQGFHRLRLADDISLTLVFGDARDALGRVEARIDAWFLDGFAPSKNPDLWTPELFAELARLSAPGATAATFSVAGGVRRALQGSGFDVEKRAGYGRKREMLTARLRAAANIASRRAPWFATEIREPLSPGARVAIIGGGVAGASVASEAAAAGLQPVIIERKALGAGASGNPAGIIMPRLDIGGSAAATFFVGAYFHALRAINNAPDGRDFNACGVLHGAASEEERARQQAMAASGLLPFGWIDLRPDGLFFPQAGVVDPVRFCERLSAGFPLVRAEALKLAGECGAFRVETDDGAGVEADSVVFANGVDALRFIEARSLPLSAEAGQVDWFPNAKPPAHAIAFGPYAAPAPKGGVVIGATRKRIAAGERAVEDEEATRANIAAVAKRLPVLAATLVSASSRPRAAVRCQTPDRLPIVGPLPDWNYYGAAYDDLRVGRKRDYPPGRTIPGAYILSGLGSRGFVTAPIAAAMLIAEMTGAPSPVPRGVAEALHPARFFIRDLKRGRTLS